MAQLPPPVSHRLRQQAQQHKLLLWPLLLQQRGLPLRARTVLDGRCQLVGIDTVSAVYLLRSSRLYFPPTSIVAGHHCLNVFKWWEVLVRGASLEKGCPQQEPFQSHRLWETSNECTLERRKRSYEVCAMVWMALALAFHRPVLARPYKQRCLRQRICF